MFNKLSHILFSIVACPVELLQQSLFSIDFIVG